MPRNFAMWFFIPFHLYLSDDGEDNDDLKCNGNEQCADSKLDRKRVEQNAVNMTDTETNYDDGKCAAKNSSFRQVIVAHCARTMMTMIGSFLAQMTYK